MYYCNPHTLGTGPILEILWQARRAKAVITPNFLEGEIIPTWSQPGFLLDAFPLLSSPSPLPPPSSLDLGVT